MSESESHTTPTVGDEYLTYFPYSEPRDAQRDGMEKIHANAKTNGFTVMEGACGTGKTLTALVPYIDLVRTPVSGFDRILVGTSVKQQMAAFQDEVDKINSSLPEDVPLVSALTLVGKSDVDPYVQMGTVASEDVYDESERLRQNTIDLLKLSEEDTGYAPKTLVDRAKQQGRSAKDNPNLPDYPYPKTPPSIGRKGSSSDDDDLEYDPFYAKYFMLKQESDDEDGLERWQLPMDPASEGLLRPDDLRDAAAEDGICPHSVMKETLRYVDIIIGNYYHIFEPQTVERMTGEYIDEETLLVLDEAHNLVPRVRDLLGTNTALSTLENAVDEVRELAMYSKAEADILRDIGQTSLNQVKESGVYSKDRMEPVEELLAAFQNNELNLPANETQLARMAMEVDSYTTPDMGADMLEAWADFVDNLLDAVNGKIENNWSQLKNQYGDDDGTLSINLRDPESPRKDDITQWAEFVDSGTDLMRASEDIGELVAAIRDALVRDVKNSDETVKTRAEWAGHVLSEWIERDNTQYFRSIKLEERTGRPKDDEDVDNPWEREYTAHLYIENCIPRRPLAKSISQFGAGVLMSATLEPIDVYREVTGMNILENADDYDEFEFEEREVVSATYGLHFPEENRETYAVNATKFKWSQKGGYAFESDGSPKMNDVRETYYDTITNVVNTTPGNTLVVMPSYSEAEWAGKLLRDDYDVDCGRVFIDKSSTNRETNRMKDQFFRSNNAVLVTGAHGTLTEGVDYKGNRLKSVVVCGVPIENTNNDTATAVQTAYEDAFGENKGFDYAFTVPAVRKTRQAIGRVIRADEDVGIRAFVDERYASDTQWDSVQEYLAPYEREELTIVEPSALRMWLDQFWNQH